MAITTTFDVGDDSMIMAHLLNPHDTQQTTLEFISPLAIRYILL